MQFLVYQNLMQMMLVCQVECETAQEQEIGRFEDEQICREEDRIRHKKTTILRSHRDSTSLIRSKFNDDSAWS